MNDSAARLFDRLQGEALPARDLVGVHRRARSLRHRRRLGAVAVTACAVAATIGAVQLLGPAGTRSGTPAAPMHHQGRSADGLLLLEDMGPGGWVNVESSGSIETVPDVLPSCTVGPRPSGKQASATSLRSTHFIRRSPIDHYEWRLTETLLAPAGDPEKISEELRQLAACTYTLQGPVLAASDTAILVGDVSRSGDLDSGRAYIWADGQLLLLSISHPSPKKSQPSPQRPTGIAGGPEWFARLTAIAVERATGKPATPPSVRAVDPVARASARPS